MVMLISSGLSTVESLGGFLILFSTITAVSAAASSGSVTNDGSIAFAINLPQADNGNNIYFMITDRAMHPNPRSPSGWTARKQKNSLVWMIYKDKTGKNITLSPRLSHGVFRMDLTLASREADTPAIPTADTSGSVQVSSKNNDSDFASQLHAPLMIFVFVVVMPVMNFNSAHQIFGLLIVVAVIGQFVLGYMHHRIYKQTQNTTKLAPIHVWLGRFVILAGTINGFLGFPLAPSPQYDGVLAGLVVIVALTSFEFWRWKRNMKAAPDVNGPGSGAQAHPWRPSSTAANGVNLE
ncbi:hypothetical protein BDZ45DRAFT_809191 [Acephala macrosclerotiorum]|nr:hypothetical protein BDZ45DRAFT_809191 [Acephala macrosclerotiorum]